MAFTPLGGRGFGRNRLLRTNKQRAQEIVASLPVDEEVLLRAEIALQRKFDLEEAARKKKMGGLYEPRTRPSTF